MEHRAYIGFATKDGDVVRVKVGTSFTSVEEARRNLDAEIPGWNLDEVAKRAQVNWNDALSKIEVHDASESRKRVFYTALYHALLLPRIHLLHGFLPLGHLPRGAPAAHHH
jgi:putative alpha-1,2-mannosidase